MDLNMWSDAASSYKSATQIARVLTESWVESNLRSPCHTDSLKPFKASTRLKDFRCGTCGAEYQLKSQQTRFGKRLTGAEYKTSFAAAKQGRFPSLLLLQRDASWNVINLTAVHRANITPEMIEPRKPLSETARRAGWQGCHINLERIPVAGQIAMIVDRRPNDPQAIVKAWSRIGRISSVPTRGRTWTLDVLRFVELLPENFALSDAYTFERELASLHPENRIVRPKIRQQLQVLRDQNLIEFVSPGQYRRLT